jgi:quinol monooxygenase YgiN
VTAYTRFYSEAVVIAVVWRFEVRPGASAEFERMYGSDGTWTNLSRRSRSFLGSSFLRDIGSEDRYLLVEYWSEMMVYEKHLASFKMQLDLLERERAKLVDRIETLGVFSALDVPDRTGPTWSRRSG